MDKINSYFNKLAKKLTFIELQKNSQVDIKGYLVSSDIPLPIIMESLLKEIKEGNIQEEINLANVVEGIIYLLGTDTEFPYINEYKAILKAYNEKINDYILYRGLKYFDEMDYDSSAIYYRALLTLDDRDVNGLFNYALALEQIANRFLKEEKSQEATDFLMKSTNNLESILDIDENYSLAYYKLGFHYKFFQQFLKAKLIWKKFLVLDKDEIRLQEIREEIEIIDDDVFFETGLTYLTYNDFGKALDSFLKLVPKYEKHWNINYFIGLSYKGIEEFNLAIEYFRKAIALNKEEADVYNELGIVYFNLEDIVKAIAVFSEGIENCKEDYKLYFNRGLGYVQLGQYEIALKDIEKANILNPEDENVSLQKVKIEELLSSI
ncbi:MAG: tetratricopeptide repeat protein [Tissierellia bacterium]|jgi:tetratricopeptide (TPR) repeat protein|nr:tetratricopeptide repeat protein [Tissierellia bacterium]